MGAIILIITITITMEKKRGWAVEECRFGGALEDLDAVASGRRADDVNVEPVVLIGGFRVVAIDAHEFGVGRRLLLRLLMLLLLLLLDPLAASDNCRLHYHKLHMGLPTLN